MKIYQAAKVAKVAWGEIGDEIMHLLKDITHNLKRLVLLSLGLLTSIYHLLLILGIITFAPDILQSIAQEFLVVGLLASLGVIYIAYIHFSQYNSIKSIFINDDIRYYDLLDAFALLAISGGFILFADSIAFIEISPIHYYLLYFGFISAILELCEKDGSTNDPFTVE